MLSERSINILKELAPILIQSLLIVFVLFIGLGRAILLGVFDEILKKWAAVIIPVILTLIGFSYQVTINEPRQIDNKAEEYFQLSYKVHPEFERMVEFQLFYFNEWYPSVDQISTALQRDSQPLSSDITVESFLNRFDKRKLELQLNQLNTLEIKASTFFFDDRTYAELVKATSGVDKEFITLLTEIQGVITYPTKLSNNELANKVSLLSKHTLDVAHKVNYAGELEKRAAATYDHNKFIKDYYLDKTRRLQVSSWLCYFTYLLPSLFLSIILAIVIYRYNLIAKTEKKMSKKAA